MIGSIGLTLDLAGSEPGASKRSNRAAPKETRIFKTVSSPVISVRDLGLVFPGKKGAGPIEVLDDNLEEVGGVFAWLALLDVARQPSSDRRPAY